MKPKLARLVAALTLSLVLAGPASSAEGTPPTSSDGDACLSPEVARRNPADADAELASLVCAEEPTFAGVYAEGDDLVVLLTSP